MSRTWKRVLWTLGVLVVAAAAGGAAFYQGLRHGYIRANEYDIRTEGILQVGDLAPDLELASVQRERPVRLSELWAAKPLVLVFGSYT